jgi:hypothetical protein
MKETNSKPTEDLAAYWRRVGPKLEQIRRKELQSMNYEEQLPIIDALLQLGCDHAKPRTSSGLVEMQRWFAKARR